VQPEKLGLPRGEQNQHEVDPERQKENQRRVERRENNQTPRGQKVGEQRAEQ
jgi:hypothetical protein